MKKDDPLFERTVRETVLSCMRTSSVSGSPVSLPVPCAEERRSSWSLQDLAMTAESGLLDAGTLKTGLLLFAGPGCMGPHSAEPDRKTRIPAYAVCGRLSFTGEPFFFPGGSGDGFAAPPLDSNYYLISLAASYFRQGGDRSLLAAPAGGERLSRRLENIFDSYCVDRKNQLCRIDEPIADWGFCSSVRKSGYLLIPSLLRLRAAKDMAYILPEKADKYRRIAAVLSRTLENAFMRGDYLISASGKCAQPDLHGCAFAVSSGALGETARERVCRFLLDMYRSKNASRGGYIRQVPLCDNYSPRSMWEDAGATEYGDGQNGGYWAAATGWYCRALSLISPGDARRLMDEFLAHTEKNLDDGAPYRFINGKSGKGSGRLCAVSAAMPYAAFREL